MTPEHKQWLTRQPNEALSRKLGIIAWILTGAVLVLVGLMRRPELRIQLPEGFSFNFLPPVHAVLNTLVSVSLVIAIITVKQGKIRAHKNAILAAMGLSVLFLLFIRFLPVMPMAELKAVTPQADVHHHHQEHKTGFGDPVSVEQGGPAPKH